MTTNLKHKAMLMLAYSSGLRISEVANLKVSDIDSARMTVLVRQGKGSKDRYTVLSKVALETLIRYQRRYKPTSWCSLSLYSDQSASCSSDHFMII
jgi:site-specific recombinase XerD